MEQLEQFRRSSRGKSWGCICFRRMKRQCLPFGRWWTMRFGGFQFALLALALSACADSDGPISGFDTITVDIPPQTAQTPPPPQRTQTTRNAQTGLTASQTGNVGKVAAPLPPRKPAPVAVAKTPPRVKPQARATARVAPPAPAPESVAPERVAREEPVQATLTPEDVVLSPQPQPQPQAAPQPRTTEPSRPAVVQEDAQGRTIITPRMPNLRQVASCKDASESVCKGLAHCAWTDTYTIGPGVYVDGYCESK